MPFYSKVLSIFFLFSKVFTQTKCSPLHSTWFLASGSLLFHGASGRGSGNLPSTHSRHSKSACPPWPDFAAWAIFWHLQQLPEEFGKILMVDRIEGQREDWTPWNQGIGPDDPPTPTQATGPDLPVIPERRAWPASCPYTEAAWGKALKGGTEAPAGTPEPTCCRSKKAELDKEEGVELELDTSGLSCFMAKGE